MKEYLDLANQAKQEYEKNQDYLSFKKGDRVEALELGMFLQSDMQKFKLYMKLQNTPLIIRKMTKKDGKPIVIFQSNIPCDAKLFKKII